MFISFSRLLASLMLCATVAGCALPSPRMAGPTPARTLDGASARSVTIISEGTRLAATVYTPAGIDSSAKLPTIVMAQGWGGMASGLETEAVEFARTGYLVLTFDYRGWGASESRVLLTQPSAAPAGHRYTAEVQEVRELIDPEDMVTDWLNVLHWLQGEPQCDTARIGLWGTGFSGGMVVTAAVRDGRVKAVYSRVGVFPRSGQPRSSDLDKEATQRARGEIGYPAANTHLLDDRKGSPIAARFFTYSPIDDVRALGKVPLAIVVAKSEELFDNREHGLLAYELHTGPKKLVTVDSTHRNIYFLGARKQAHEVAQAWFDQHLKAR
ncbi:MAG: CocE/NonD family hydrolase [Rhizobacter sp.]